jgi:hypothetical protein
LSGTAQELGQAAELPDDQVGTERLGRVEHFLDEGAGLLGLALSDQGTGQQELPERVAAGPAVWT